MKPDEELEINGLKWQKINLGAAILRHVKEASPVNLRTALVNSDNIYFAQQTLRMGKTNLELVLINSFSVRN